MRLALFLFSGVGMFIAGFAAYRYWEKVKELRRTDRLISSLDQVKWTGCCYFKIFQIGL